MRLTGDCITQIPALRTDRLPSRAVGSRRIRNAADESSSTERPPYRTNRLPDRSLPATEASEAPVMCGIIGYIGPREAQPILLEGLRRLEYRGYDSAGVATLAG